VIVPLREGRVQVRACLFYGGALLQSGALSAPVGASARGGVAEQLDYLSSANFADLDRRLQPAATLFTNQSADGTHWIGAYSRYAAASQSTSPQAVGLLKTFDSQTLAALAEQLRAELESIQGQNPYRYDARLTHEQRMARLEGDLTRLARCGWKVYHNLFLQDGDEQQWDQLPSLERPGVVTVARCQEGPSIPWAALYDRPLYDAPTLQLCGYFKQEMNRLREGEVPGFRERDGKIPCYGAAHCPLTGPERRTTVCPFGFWGFTHQVEQPIQALPEIDRRPKDLAQLNQVDRLARRQNAPVQLGAGLNPRILDSAAHMTELNQLAQATGAQMALSDTRDEVLQLLLRQDVHLYYFYCHGREQGQQFRLVFGPPEKETAVAASDLDPRYDRWAGEQRPLVILNGCETVKLTPEVMHGFLGTLRGMGASGVVGSEIPIHAHLAMPFGRALVQAILTGSSMGEAFLDLRRKLLEQGNPLGLVYTAHASAALHLHDEDCAWCRVHL
jgi:hypothetical protein